MRTAVVLLLTMSLAACDARGGSDTYYLFRSPIVGSPGERIHVATFNSKDGRLYNEENCTIVRRLMEQQPGVQVSYWCTQLKP